MKIYECSKLEYTLTRIPRLAIMVIDRLIAVPKVCKVEIKYKVCKFLFLRDSLNELLKIALLVEFAYEFFEP